MKPGPGNGASVKFWWWTGSAVAALVAACCLWVAAAGTPARAAASVGEALQAGGREAGKPGESAHAPGLAATGVRSDAGAAAREVLQGDDFWWKRTERVELTVPKTGIAGFFAKVGEFLVQLIRPLRPVWDLFVDFLRALWRLWRSLYGWMATGDWTGGSQVIWLIAAVILGWAIWKLSPFVVRWISGLAGAPGAQPEANASWQKLPEAADLFTQARDALTTRQYADAIRLALLALIAQLEKRGLIRYDTTRTNREYQMELRPQGNLAASFGQLARIYERVWYGKMPAGPAEAEAAMDLCQLLLNREEVAPE